MEIIFNERGSKVRLRSEINRFYAVVFFDVPLLILNEIPCSEKNS